MAASRSQGTGAQNLARALRRGWAEVSGMALGPSCWRRLWASSVVRPGGKVLGGAEEGGEEAMARWSSVTMGPRRCRVYFAPHLHMGREEGFGAGIFGWHAVS